MSEKQSYAIGTQESLYNLGNLLNNMSNQNLI